MKIVIASDFSKTPGARFKSEGKFSGEEFRDTLLIPKYNEAVKKGELLEVDFDGCYGYATSFLEEAFGGLVRKLGQEGVLNNIKIISNDDETIEPLIYEYVSEAEKNYNE